MTHTHDELLKLLDDMAEHGGTLAHAAAAAIRDLSAKLEAERSNKKIAQDNADHWRKQYLDGRDTLESLKTRIQQFQFCIEQVASALGVCCGGVDSSPEDQLSDPHSTTRVLCDAINSERKAREEWEKGIRYHDGKNAYWENRAEAAEQDRDAFRELLAIHNLGGMTDFNIGPMKRALAAESRLATVFERTRERAAKEVENLTRFGSMQSIQAYNTVYNCVCAIRALQPEGEESAAAQVADASISTTDESQRAQLEGDSPASAADPFNCPKCGAHDFGLNHPNCPHCGFIERVK